MPKRRTQEEFIILLEKLHGDKYDYSFIEYINNKTKVKLHCKVCDKIIVVLPQTLLKGNCACLSCHNRSQSKTTEQFIEEANIVHNGKYKYPGEYINAKTKIRIICEDHGDFYQTPISHLSGNGCPKCFYGYTTSEFITKANIVHENNYSYPDEYIKSNTKLKIICSEHGIFEQTPSSHLNGSGCPKCVGVYDTDSFVEKANIVHRNKYTYPGKYIKSHTKIKIKCEKHGIFEQLPYSHLNGSGCPVCNESKGEKQISEILDNNNIEYVIQKTFGDCRYVNKLRFDFYLPEYNLCIEYNGLQHYEVVEFFGGEEGFVDTQKRDTIKTNYCIDNNIGLLIIKYYDDVSVLLDSVI